MWRQLPNKFRWWFALALATTLVGTTLPVHAAQSHSTSANISESRQGAGSAIHKAIRVLAKALRAPGMPRVIEFLTRYTATQEQIAVVQRYAGATAGILEDLTKLDQLSLAFVRGQVEGLLVKYAGATQVDASRVAYWVEKALDWGL